MRKALLSAAFIAACISASAQKLTYIPWTDNAFIQGTVISNNGKYVAGSDFMGRGFIYDTENKEMKYFVSPQLGGEDTESTVDADVRCVTNDGIGVGYLEEVATKFDFATGKYEKILDEGSIANYITSDGKIFGITYNKAYQKTPIMIVDGKKTELPQSSEAWLGFENDGMGIRGGNADGSVLLGYGQDNYATFPLMIWALNKDNTTYSVIPVCKKYLDASDFLDGPQDFDWFEGAAISSNGKYVAINLHNKNEEQSMEIARYNVVTDTYENITCPELSADMWCYANAIADDGTIVGYIEDQMSGARYACIVKAGETEAKRMSEVFPTLTDIVKMDGNEFNSPCAITPDGRYIAGFGYVDMDDENLCWGTYYIDTQSSTDGVDNAAADAKASKVVASYGIDGKKTRPAANRLHINKFANGKAVKVVK